MLSPDHDTTIALTVAGALTPAGLGGAMIELDEPMKMKGGEEMTVSFELPADAGVKVARGVVAAAPKRGGKAATVTTKKVKTEEQRIKCTVAWIDKKCTKAGIMFARLTDPQRKAIEDLLRNTVS